MTPRVAFDAVGKQVYEELWRESWIDDVDAQERKEILQYLRTALKSGQVAAHWSTYDFRYSGDLTPQEADREFFRIDLKNDCVFHHDMNEPVICKIHRRQLLSFFQMQSGSDLPPTDLATRECMKWLVEEFSDPDFTPPRSEDLMKLAMQKIPRLSVRGYKAARKAAIEKTGRKDIGKAGRRKNQIGT